MYTRGVGHENGQGLGQGVYQAAPEGQTGSNPARSRSSLKLEGGGGGRDPRALLHRRGQDHLVAHTALLSLLGLGSRID